MIDITKFMLISTQKFDEIIQFYGSSLTIDDKSYLITYFFVNFLAYFLILVFLWIILYLFFKIFSKKGAF